MSMCCLIILPAIEPPPGLTAFRHCFASPVRTVARYWATGSVVVHHERLFLPVGTQALEVHFGATSGKTIVRSTWP